jgi:hypothetical protein
MDDIAGRLPEVSLVAILAADKEKIRDDAYLTARRAGGGDEGGRQAP